MRTYILLRKFKNAESGLYYIDGRYYSPETRQFLSPVPAETMFSNALTVFGLNPYHITLDNTVNRVYNGYTIHPSVTIGKNDNTFNHINQGGDYIKIKPQSNQLGGDGFSYIVTGIDFVFATTMAYMYGFAQSYGRTDMMNFATGFGSTLTKITNGLNIAGTAINAVTDLINNYQNGASSNRILADAIVDIGVGVFSYKLSMSLGALMGSAVPDIGNLVGSTAGLLVAALLNAPGFNEFLKDTVYGSLNFFVQWFEKIF